MKLLNVSSKILFLCVTTVFITACQTGSDEIIQDSTSMDGVEQSQLEGSGVSAESTTDLTVLEDGSDSSAIAFDDDAQAKTKSPQAMLDNADSNIANRVIYFQYDSAKISDDSLSMIEAHGNFIASNGNVSARLEGNTDERGTREHNIALGDRRAQSVRRLLLFQGASADQLETISYGEERPAVLGHTEDAWVKNRRVEIVYEVN
jgi:peptidoglycan-associated lipoprotein